MTPLGAVLFIAGVLLLRLVGGFALAGSLAEDERIGRLLLLMPLSIVAAVVAVQTFATKTTIVFDARVVGVGLAAVLAWRRVPMGVVVVIAAFVTAMVRLTGWG